MERDPSKLPPYSPEFVEALGVMFPAPEVTAASHVPTTEVARVDLAYRAGQASIAKILRARLEADR